MEAHEKRSLRILLVDDDHDTVTLLVRLLAQSGHRVHAAQCCDTALDLARDSRYDVLLCDLAMRGRDGYEVLKEVRALHPIRAVAITGCGKPETAAKVAEAGFEALLPKPLDMDRLNAVLEMIALEIDLARCFQNEPRLTDRAAVAQGAA